MFDWEQHSNWENVRKVSLVQCSRADRKKLWLKSITQVHILILYVHFLLNEQDHDS